MKFLKVVGLLLGLLFLAISVLMRYSTAAISAGQNFIYFKLYNPFPHTWFRLSLFVLLGAVVLALVGLARTRAARQAWQALRQDARSLRFALAAVGLFLLTMIPLAQTTDTPFRSEQEMVVYLIFGTLGTLLVLVSAGPLLERATRPLEGVYRQLMQMRSAWFLLGCTLFVFLVANAVSYFLFHHMPHINDTVAQVFQARIFAAGKLFLKSLPLPQFYDAVHVINEGRWYSQYPFGHPLLLMFGVLAGAPWLVNPVLGALTIPLIYKFGAEVYDEGTARLGTLLATLSPFLLFMSSEFMNHTSALFFAALFLLALARMLKGRGAGYALLAGFALGMAFDIRPFTALLLGLPFAVEAALRLVRWKSGHEDTKNTKPEIRTGEFIVHRSSFIVSRSFRYVQLLAAFAVMAGLLLLQNQLTVGNAFRMGYVAKWGPGVGLGLGRSGWGQAYELPNAIAGTSIDLNSLNRFLFEFPIPSLLFIVVLFASGRLKRWDWLLVGSVAALVAGYFFYWWHAPLFGPRWQFEALPALVLLTARGLKELPHYIAAGLKLPVPLERTRAGLRSLLAVCYLSMLGVAMPTLLKHYGGEFGIRSSTARHVRSAGLKDAVVFARRYEEVFLQNRLSFDGDIVYVKDLGTVNPLVMTRYPGRRAYFAFRDSVRELRDVDFDGSSMKEGLDSAVAEIRRMDLGEYRTLVWPAAELESMVRPVLTDSNARLVSYRELQRNLVGDVDALRPYLPALAAWVVGDRSDALVILTMMNAQVNFVVEPHRFTCLGTTVNGRVTLFDIRPVESGQMMTAPPLD